LQIVHLEVRPDPAYGWAAFVVADLRKVTKYQSLVEAIGSKLRADFDLLD